MIRMLSALSLLSALALTGCGLGTPATSTPEAVHLNITGTVHGGQQPVAGAHVHLMILREDRSMPFVQDYVDPSQIDSFGYYVTTAADGSFSITNDYGACPSGDPAYLLVTEGNPGLAAGTDNTALAELAPVGICNSHVFSPTLQIGVTEQSTVATAYALAGYMTGPGTISNVSSALSKTGFNNAFATAQGLLNQPTGTVNATTASGGTVPTAAITSLANIMSACVNSNGTGSACTTLFANATSDGTSTGTKPTDTVTAMLNIAHHPAANVSNLYGLVTAAPAFGGGLATAPNDFTLAVSYPPAAFLGLNSPGIPAVDASGNVWFASTVNTTIFSVPVYSVTEFSPLGAVLTQSAVLHQPTQVAIDPGGNAWVAQRSGGVVSKITPGATGTETDFPYNGTSNDNGHQIAIDTSGNVYLNDYTTGKTYGLLNSGAARGSITLNSGSNDVALLTNGEFLTYDLSNFIGGEYSNFAGEDFANGSGSGLLCGRIAICDYGGLTAPTSLAMDSGGHLWALNSNSTLSGFDTTGANTANSGGYLTGSPFFGGGLNTTANSPTQPYPWVAIDGGNNVWVANYTGSVSEFSSVGTALTPAYTSATQPGGFYGSAPSCKGQGLAIDGSGNLWVGCDSATTPVLEYIGAAVPVSTPLLPGNFGVKP